MHMLAAWLDRLAILLCRHRETCFVRTKDARYALRCLACGALSPGTES
jgi:hypothetical protein